jgi:hypothetical protein
MATQFTDNLTDPLARLEWWIRREVLPGTIGESAATRLKMILEKAPEKSTFVKHRLDEAIYLVLNHPPLRPKKEERHFIAAMNLKAVSQATKHFLRRLPASTLKLSIDRACELLFYNNETDSALEQAAKWLWHQKWDHYWRITLQGEKERGLYTWNQLLLKQNARAIPLGLCWLHDTAPQKEVPYFSLSGHAAQMIGVPQFSPSGWIEKLLATEFTDQHIRRDSYLPDLDALLNAFNYVDPGGHERRSGAVAWAVFNLVKYYAVWGGGAFLSIPITIGAHGLSRTAVLSLCTEKPISLPAYRDWKMISDVIFRPLVEEELATLVKRLDFAEAAYGIGHPMKNRVMPLSRALDQLEADITDGRSPNELRRSIGEARTSLRIIENLGHVLDTLSRGIKKEEKERVFLAKPKDWTMQQAYDLSTAFRNICKRPLPASCSQTVNLILDEAGQQMWIDPWIAQSGEDKCRPHDLFYDEIIQEVIINAARHSQVDPVEVRVSNAMIQNLESSFFSVIVSNYCDKPQSLQELNLPSGKWKAFELSAKGAAGGLPILTTFLQTTGLGKELLVRIDAEQRGIRFSVALPFEGLRRMASATSKSM